MTRNHRLTTRPTELKWASGSIRCLLFAAGLLLVGLSSSPARAWFDDGHMLIVKLAVAATPADLPDFFRGGAGRIAAASVEPDVLRRRELPQLRSSESPEHYLDREFLEGASLPATRYEYLSMLFGKGLDPTHVGTVPYAIEEATQHLAVSFAEYRLRPDDKDLQSRILYRAGILSHYAADMSQPLHTTWHFNGRRRPDGSSPGSGIHALVDSLPIRAGASFSPAPCAPWPAAFADLRQGVVEALESSHALVDRVYELEDRLDWDEGDTPDQEIVAFASERLTAAALFTARLYATAWELSKRVELPESVLARAQKQAE